MVRPSYLPPPSLTAGSTHTAAPTHEATRRWHVSLRYAACLAEDMTELGSKVSSDRIALQAHKLVALSPRIAAAERRMQSA